MKCPKCTAENPETQRFCGECGTKLDTGAPGPDRIRGHVPDPAEPGALSQDSGKKAPPEFDTRPEDPIDEPASDTKTYPPGLNDQVSVTRTLETTADELSKGAELVGGASSPGGTRSSRSWAPGGMGRVYRAFDKKIEEEVALKLIRPEIAAEKRTVERFRNELRLAREIGHRHVCRMYDLNEEHGAYDITMEYVPGEDLRSFICRSKQLAVGTAVSIARQVCEGLAEAHRLGVVHRDLKPSNIMIDREGNARIMDFGIARSLKSRGITGEGVTIGTPEHMSPEQAEGKEVDRRSDIYSLGVILYEMVTGRPPFEGDTPLAVAMKHKVEAPKSPKLINPQVSDAMSEVILKCLEKDRDNRYGSAKASVLCALGRYEDAIQTLEGFLQKNPDHRTTSRNLAEKLVIFGRFDEALAISEEPYPGLKSPSAAATLMFAGRLEEADSLCKEYRDAPDPRDRCQWGIVSASLLQLKGRFQEAKARLLAAVSAAKTAGEDAWLVLSLFQAAHVDMASGSLDDALLEIAEALNASAGRTPIPASLRSKTPRSEWRD